jgi:hypothetical protein
MTAGRPAAAQLLRNTPLTTMALQQLRRGEPAAAAALESAAASATAAPDQPAALLARLTINLGGDTAAVQAACAAFWKRHTGSFASALGGARLLLPCTAGLKAAALLSAAADVPNADDGVAACAAWDGLLDAALQQPAATSVGDAGSPGVAVEAAAAEPAPAEAPAPPPPVQPQPAAPAPAALDLIKRRIAHAERRRAGDGQRLLAALRGMAECAAGASVATTAVLLDAWISRGDAAGVQQGLEALQRVWGAYAVDGWQLQVRAAGSHQAVRLATAADVKEEGAEGGGEDGERPLRLWRGQLLGEAEARAEAGRLLMAEGLEVAGVVRVAAAMGAHGGEPRSDI